MGSVQNPEHGLKNSDDSKRSQAWFKMFLALTHIFFYTRRIFPPTYAHTSCCARNFSLALAYIFFYAGGIFSSTYAHTSCYARDIFSCTHTHTSFYARGIFSLARTHILHALLQMFLLHIHTYLPSSVARGGGTPKKIK
jgi:transposase InsO family protein